jgi:hypothetical protein
MKKAKLERGRFRGRIKTVTARRRGRVVGQMPFDQLVEEVADDPNFSVAQHASKRHAGKVADTRAVKANSAKAVPAQPPQKEEFDEAVSLLLRVRPLLQDTQRGSKLKEQIENFLDRVV